VAALNFAGACRGRVRVRRRRAISTDTTYFGPSRAGGPWPWRGIGSNPASGIAFN